MNFNELNLRAPIQRAITEFGYTTPSPIQQKAIPPVLEGNDLIGCAQTGTGKTAAFALPMLELLAQGRRAKSGEIRALILTPTRELALQIGQNFTDYGKYTGLRHAVIFGGVGQAPQVAAIKRGLDVLIACPGRLNDLTNQGYVNLAKLEIFVLDEADRMLDMGFVHDVKRVVAKLPPKRQNLMFSATMPKEIETLANTFLTNPVRVKVNPVSSTVERIDQSLYFVEKGNKLALLIHLIKELGIANALVFSRTKHGADKIVKQLEKANIPAAAIHGNKGQTARVTALENFKAGKTQVLVATDIAARGIDINELSHVFNFDLPEVAETYVHRIGRTARAGADGVAISFCASEEKEYLQGIEKLNRKQIPVVQNHPWAGKASPVKAVLAPVRGRKPAAQESGAKSAAPKGGAKPEQTRNSRQIAQGAGRAPTARRKEEPTMQNKDNRGQNRDAKPASGGDASSQGRGNRNNRNQRNGRSGNQPAAPRSEKPRPATPAQPKFDPRFLSPQAAEQIPHTAAVAQQAPAAEMLDVRRMNQNRTASQNNGGNRQNSNGNRTNQRGQNNNRGGRGNNRGQNANDNRNQAAQGEGAGQARGTNRDAASQNNRGQNSNRNNNNNAPRNNGNQPARAPQQNRNAAPQGAAGEQAARGSRNERGNHNNRGQNSNQNNYRDERSANRNPAPQAGNRSPGKINHAGLRTVRSGKAAPTNEKDPGLELITKRPPQQKFTSFDAYMLAHGGATAPVEEYGDK